MRRRSFLKTLSATAGLFATLPIPEVRPGITMDLMRRFASQDSFARYAMSDPFVEEGNCSASDGHVGLRVFDTMGLADTDKPVNLPPLANAFATLFHPDAAWKPWPKAEYDGALWGACWQCNAKGFMGVLRPCTHCDGEGEICEPTELDTSTIWEHGIECKKCCGGWMSDVPCARCGGRPYDERFMAGQQLDDEFSIAARYHHSIAMLPGAEFSISKPLSGHLAPPQGNRLVLVRFEGGQGMCAVIKDQKR